MKITKLITPSSENEIKSHWKYIDKVYVSVICITFNHDNYIRDAIDSFLAQETEFRFEIIVHDDVSTDTTRDILQEYKEKYPGIIKLVLQDENQYKLGKKITPLAVAHASGEYIALCEGDDFWIDKNKLQRQIIFLEGNLEYGLILTDYHLKQERSGEIKYNLISNNRSECLSRLNFESFLTSFGYFAPMTWVVRVNLLHKIIGEEEGCPDGTFVWLLNLLRISKVKVLFDATAVHRHLVESASKSDDVNKILLRNKGLLDTQLKFHSKYKLEESLIKKFHEVHFILNVNTFFSKKITRAAYIKIIKEFKFSYLSKMNVTEILKMIIILTLIPYQFKCLIFKLIKKVKFN